MKRILVIDDNADNRYLVRFFLEKNGYTIIEAVDGESGIELAAKEMPDLILMDIQLPGIDGYEATRRIRRSKRTNKIPIIALTSCVMAGDEANAKRAGCNSYIPKPIDLTKFLEQIEKALADKATTE